MMTCDTERTNTNGVHDFTIADFKVRIIFKDIVEDGMNILPSFRNFRSKALDNDDFLFILTIEEDLRCDLMTAENIGTFDTGNGDTIVDKYADGGYRFVMKDISGRQCCMLITDKDFSHCRCMLNGDRNLRYFGLNNALMLVFAFAASRFETLLMHASVVRQNGYGYAFIAKSGTGKSTHTGLWVKHIDGCDLMNDDTPIIRIINGQPYIYGSPWSGKTPCYRPIKAKLVAITRIDRAGKNSIEKMRPVAAFASLLPSCSSMKWDKDIHDSTCKIITKLVETANIYILHCLPDKEAAVLCNKEISK